MYVPATKHASLATTVTVALNSTSDVTLHQAVTSMPFPRVKSCSEPVEDIPDVVFEALCEDDASAVNECLHYTNCENESAEDMENDAQSVKNSCDNEKGCVGFDFEHLSKNDKIL